MTTPRHWKDDGWRRISHDRKASLKPANETTQVYRYRCMAPGCYRRWRTTLCIQRQCPFCKSSEEIQRVE